MAFQANGRPGQLANRTYLFRLPLELVYYLVDHLDPEAFISLGFAYYSALQDRGLVPRMTHQRIDRITDGSAPLHRLLMLPSELLLQVMRNLGPRATMAFVLANYHGLLLRRIVPRLTRDTLRELRRACE